MDVKMVLLNGNIDETIYMMQLENFVWGDSKEYANLRNPSMNSNKHLDNSISNFIKLSSYLVLR